MTHLALVAILHQLVNLRPREDDGKHPVLEAVVVKDIGEGGRDDAANAKVAEGPRRMLPAAAASKVVRCDNYGGLAIALLVEDKVWSLGSVVKVSQTVECSHAETAPLDRLEKLLGNDHVRICMYQSREADE